ncbi:DUF937 domain-containing protein [Sphingobacterium psychroaquaticum]|uniref:DUF937 domain-containing protein n=1 Tax=Sphingobacterium psychroaquaticum TaxID=561061 RepID=UPI00106C7FDF|nr:DUF937 domain-containing protein [Sphingobacterium psychroaquaticum]QBQ41948.1 DUF937 domain-containing protein [Sphingobacterium psychroaquaticum]
MGITDLITGGIGSKAISAISSTLGVSETKAKWIVAAAVPLMIAALNYNSKNKGQAENIDKALDQHSSSGILDKISDVFGSNNNDDGGKIVNHMFGKNTESVTQNFADKLGLSSAQVGGVLASLAPMVMGYLGQQKQSANSGGGIGDLIGSVLGGGGAQQASTGGGIGDLIGNIFGGGGNTQAAAQSNGITDMIGNLAGDFFNQNKSQQDKGGILDSLAGMFGK